MSDASTLTRSSHATEGDDGAAGYDLTAELVFSNDELVLAPTLSTCPELRVELEGHSSVAGQSHLSVSVLGSCFESLDAALDADPTVADARPVATFDDEAVYRVTPAAETRRILPRIVAVDGVVRDVAADAEGWTVQLHLPTRAALVSLNEGCRDDGISVSVRRLSALERMDRSTPLPLTADQRTLLTAAREQGYFETPRRVSQRELAERFDVSPSAISQRLRTAVGALVATTFSV